MYDVGEQLGLTHRDVDSLVVDHLVPKGLAKLIGSGKHSAKVELTPAGIEAAEEYEAELAKRETEGEPTAAVVAAPQAPTKFYMTGDNIHPKIAEKAWGIFKDGYYNEAILAATKAVEVEVRTKAGLADAYIGLDLMSKAFKSEDPILKCSDHSQEQKAAQLLFMGAIGFFKNPQSHRDVGISDQAKTFECLCLASLLLRMVDESQKVRTSDDKEDPKAKKAPRNPVTNRSTPGAEVALTEEARALLLEAVQDKNGFILRQMAQGGLWVQTNEKTMNVVGDPRSEATWDGAVDELIERGLIKNADDSGDVFMVTGPGFKLVDRLKKEK
jgi:uncharacterized protein (TIGR02391 family)